MLLIFTRFSYVILPTIIILRFKEEFTIYMNVSKKKKKIVIYFFGFQWAVYRLHYEYKNNLSARSLVPIVAFHGWFPGSGFPCRSPGMWFIFILVPGCVYVQWHNCGGKGGELAPWHFCRGKNIIFLPLLPGMKTVRISNLLK